MQYTIFLFLTSVKNVEGPFPSPALSDLTIKYFVIIYTYGTHNCMIS